MVAAHEEGCCLLPRRPLKETPKSHCNASLARRIPSSRILRPIPRLALAAGLESLQHMSNATGFNRRSVVGNQSSKQYMQELTKFLLDSARRWTAKARIHL
jgi:hypothetical protein